MSGTLTPSEEAQLQQTIEMFEVITQSQPQDYQSLEILKEAYLKLGRDTELVATSKRIAEAYVQLGQLSSAILEYETVLQRFPGDPDVEKALAEIEGRANNLSSGDGSAEQGAASRENRSNARASAPGTAILDDGKATMRRLFVDGKHINASEFDMCWPDLEVAELNGGLVTPFIQELHEKNMMSAEKSLKLLCDKSRLGYLPLELYDVQVELARSYPPSVCRRWCVLPFDKVGRSVLVATTNPFNLRAAKELQDANPGRIQWYLASPADLMREIRKAFRS
ncbi:MAG TPA: hypothetical protein DCY13_11210 [Verrucomicrobiales bacterium]|nr:hypothetical protein [Verrucomicrobiales bacterium]